jgi:hypothetical protein
MKVKQIFLNETGIDFFAKAKEVSEKIAVIEYDLKEYEKIGNQKLVDKAKAKLVDLRNWLDYWNDKKANIEKRMNREEEKKRSEERRREREKQRAERENSEGSHVKKKYRDIFKEK